MGNHDKFLHLDKSESAVWDVAKWLHGRGHSVEINCGAKAPDSSQWKKYVDNGDLEIALKVEVKHLSADFIGKHDWPFGGDFIG